MSSRIKVLIVIRGKSLKGGGGAERRFIRLLDFLNRSDIKLITNREFAESIFESRILKNRDLIIYPNRSLSIIEFNIWLVNAITRIKPDVIHLPLIQKSLIPFYIWLNLLNNKINVTSSIVWTKYLLTNSLSFMDKFIGYLIYKKSKVIDVLYPSALNNSNFKKYLSKIKITPCSFTDYEVFKPSLYKENLVVFAGRLIPEKNPLLFLYAIREIKNRYPKLFLNWKFLILGRGKLEDRIKNFIFLNSFGDNVELKSVYSTHDYLSRSKIFVSLQYPTNYPSQSLLEAMATENAIIATDDEDTRLLIDNNCGILIKSNIVELVDSLIKLMIDENLRQKLAKNARHKVISQHRIEIFAKYITELWENVRL